MTKALLVVNPSSGGEKGKEFACVAEARLKEFFDEVYVRETEKEGDAAIFVSEAAKDKYHSVFVMGGDGTVNEGISGLAEKGYKPKFGFFPLGTVNDLARALNIPLDPEEAIAKFDPKLVKPLDIGKINDKYFMNVVAVGTIPEAINDVESEDKTKLGKLAYFVSGLKHIVSNKNYNFRLTLDGKQKEITSSTLLIGLTNSIGGFEHILPEAEVNDGLLHLIYIKDSNLIETINSLPDMLKGIDESTSHVEYMQFSEGIIEIIGEEENLNVNVDGDEGDSLPIKIKILPSHLDVYCGA